MLTNREFDVFNIVNNAEKNIIASDVVKMDESGKLTINTVQAVLKKLLRYGVIEVGEIVYSGTVLSRAYRPSRKAPKIIAKMLVEDYKKYQHVVSKEMFIEELNKSK